MNRNMEITIEVTSNCQAKCPGCIRHKVFNPETDTVSAPPKNWNLPVDIHHRLIDSIADKVKYLTYDGSFGDSPFHPDFLELIEYSARKLKGDSKPYGDGKSRGMLSNNFNGLHDLTISTNGSYKPPSFWKKLGEILNEHLPGRHHVMFDLDGTDNETQNMYRVGTDYNKIIKNAEAFISGGGCAVWKMIPFDFNDELEETAKMLAAKHGFEKFQRNRIQRVEQKAVQIALAEKMNELDTMKAEDEDLKQAVLDDVLDDYGLTEDVDYLDARGDGDEGTTTSDTDKDYGLHQFSDPKYVPAYTDQSFQTAPDNTGIGKNVKATQSGTPKKAKGQATAAKAPAKVDAKGGMDKPAVGTKSDTPDKATGKATAAKISPEVTVKAGVSTAIHKEEVDKVLEYHRTHTEKRSVAFARKFYQKGK